MTKEVLESYKTQYSQSLDKVNLEIKQVTDRETLLEADKYRLEGAIASVVHMLQELEKAEKSAEVKE